jgi:hypothetical protein
MQARRVALALAAALALLPSAGAAASAPEAATPSPFRASAEDLRRVARGECISYVAEEPIAGHPRMVLLAYQKLRTSRERLARAMTEPSAYTTVLPRTLEAHVQRRRGETTWIGLTQGNGFVQLRYVMQVEPSEDRSLYRFWIDERYPHDLDDAWGFLRLEALAGSRGLREDQVGDYLVTYGLVFDLGGGILQSMFSQRILAVLRTIPERLKRYVEPTP